MILLELELIMVWQLVILILELKNYNKLICKKGRLWWDEGNRWINLRISTKALKSIQKVGLGKFAKSQGIDLKKF